MRNTLRVTRWALLLLMLMGLAPLAAQAQEICYAVADAGGGNGGDDLLTQVDRNTGAETAVGTGLGTSTTEAIAFSPFSGRLYAANAGQFGEVNTTTGVFSAIGSGFGTGDGVFGSISFSDVDGLHFDPYPGELYGVHRRGNGNDGNNDVMFQINRTTGAYIPGAYPDYDGDGNPDDYLAIYSGEAIDRWDIDDLAIDPANGKMYGAANNGGSNDELVEINRVTGAVTVVGNMGVFDIEGLSFDTDGELFGSSGTSGTPANSLFDINKSTGAATLISNLSEGTDYEGLACLTDGVNTITGRVYLDADEDAFLDPGETGEAGIIVRLFRDDNGNGQIDPGEPQVGTQLTNSVGDYTFEVAGTGDFVVTVLAGDLPQGSTFTTDDVETAHFDPGTYGGVDASNNFGYTAPPPASDLAITKTSNATGPVPPGFTLEYTITITNNGGVDQTGVAVRDTLPGNITYVASSSEVTAPGTTNDTFRDEFNAQNYSGNNGTANWSADWSEVGENGKPDKNDVQVQQDGANPAYAVFIKKVNKGLERTADLSSYDSASLTFRYRGQGTGAGDIMTVYVNGTQVAQVTGSQTSYTTFGPVDLDAYAGANATVRFLVTTLGSSRQFWVDDVELAASGTGTTTTPGNAPPLLTSGHTLAPGEQLTVTLQATVDASPSECSVANTAWTQSNEVPTWQSATQVDVIDSGTSCSLPVELTSFDVLLDGPDALLRWQTASETNNAGFEVQIRHANIETRNTSWEVLDFVPGAGTTLEAQAYEYRAEGLEPGRYTFRLKQVDYDGAFEYSPEVEVVVAMAERFTMEPAYPNPFNPEAQFRFAVQQEQAVRVELFDLLGRRVKVLYQGTPPSGQMQTVRIDGSDLSSGLYLVRVAGKTFVETQRVTLVK